MSCELQNNAKAFNQMEESETVEEVQADLNAAKEGGRPCRGLVSTKKQLRQVTSCNDNEGEWRKLKINRTDKAKRKKHL